MGKYLHFFKTNVQQFFEYRTDLAVSLALKLFSFIAFAFIWSRIAEEGNVIREYGLSGIIIYYLLTIVLHGLTTSQSARDLRDSILTGQLSSNLVKPFKVSIYLLTKHFARVTSETILHVLLVCPILFLFPSLVGEFHIGTVSLLQFVIVVAFSSVLNFNIFFTIGLAAFWTKEATGLQAVIRNSTRLFTGELMPVDLFPQVIQKITVLLPFQYILFFPIKILLSDVSLKTFTDALLVIIIWNIFFCVINFLLWKFGLKQYEAVGI
ncbi:MAG: ABC-2 family transporter protein [Patescibacteria group bacterium]|nr:ABC-2 family transporter protein [Patescibacteria group bacterium]